ncbi:hypothetical protein GCM10011529_28650 [Polymorphobacter glacialis]|uniref:Uncharacterized protein n=1 Tax=Sandarakinorhabdus glacialis TaxID=1614636 RepID=A0A917EB30_9SPHN|nr:hypothetical protein GCM10011529_28650 [Polymorphobacter glacialis]
MLRLVDIEAQHLRRASIARLRRQPDTPAAGTGIDQFNCGETACVEYRQMLPIEDILPYTFETGANAAPVGSRKKSVGHNF